MATTLLVAKNRAYSKLAAALTDSATSLDVKAGEGANFPDTYPFHLTIEDEIVSCTNRSTDTLTIVRAQQSTTAATHANKSYVALNITAKSTTDLNTAVNTIEATVVSAEIVLGDDKFVKFGAGGDAQIGYESADPNALALIFALPHATEDANNVPVAVFGDLNIVNVNLGFFDGITQPRVAVVDADRDSWVSFGFNSTEDDKGEINKGGSAWLNIQAGGTIPATATISSGLNAISGVYDFYPTLTAAQEYRAGYFRANYRSTTPGNPVVNDFTGVEGVAASYTTEEAISFRGGHFRTYINADATSTMRTAIGVEASARASYSGGTACVAEAGTAFVGARIYMAPYFSAGSVDNLNNFWGLWIYGEHATQRNADSAIKISDAGGGFTYDITFQEGTTLVDDGTNLTLAGANFVSTLGATTLAGTVTGGSQVINSLGNIGIGATSDVDIGIYIEKTFTDTDNSGKAGLRANIQFAKTSAAMTSAGWGLYGQAILDSTNTQNWTHADAGLRGVCGYIGTETGSTGTISTVASLFANAAFTDSATVTNWHGVHVCTPSVAGSKLTNAYGIYVCDMNTGATLNYAIYTGAGLVRFGGATTISMSNETTATNGLWISLTSTVTSGDLTGIRSRVYGNAASSGANVRGGYLEAKMGGASKYAAMLEGALIHADYSAGDATISGDVRGLTVHISQGSSLDAANLYGILVSIQTRGDETIGTDDVGLLIRNEAVGGNGRQMGYALKITDLNMGGETNGFDVGISFAGITCTTAEIDLDFGKIIFDQDGDTDIHCDTDDELDFKLSGSNFAIFAAGVIRPGSDDAVDLGSSSKQFKNLYVDGVAYVDSFGETIYINDTANAKMTLGLTINQGTADDEILALKSSDVATGRTSVAETDTYGLVAKSSADYGGLRIGAMGENNASHVRNLYFSSSGGQADTTKSSAGRSLIEFNAEQHNGADTVADITADGNVLGIRARVSGATITIALVDEDGDLWLGGGLTLGGGTPSATGVVCGARYLEVAEMSAPGAGAANTARIYALQGAGDALTDLCAVFQDGTVDVFAQEATDPDSPIFEYPGDTDLKLVMKKPDRKTIQFVASFPDGREFVMRELRYPTERW